MPKETLFSNYLREVKPNGRLEAKSKLRAPLANSIQNGLQDLESVMLGKGNINSWKSLDNQLNWMNTRKIVSLRCKDMRNTTISAYSENKNLKINRRAIL